jgi:adenosine deaminase
MAMPKVELHAHLNGSISTSTVSRLGELHRRNFPSEPIDEAVGTKMLSGFDEGFNYFTVVQQLTDHPEAVALAAREVIRDFAADNVKYLELRSTPRAVAGRMTKEQYVEAILTEARNANADPSLDIVCKLLLSVDRRQSAEAAGEAAKLCLVYHKSHPDVIVGLDLSGDARVGDLFPLFPLLKAVREDTELRLSVHLAEVPNEPEVSLVLRDLKPDRIGHGTAIHPE